MKEKRFKLATRSFAFLYREHHAARRGWSWILVFNVYALVNSISIGLIGVYIGNAHLTVLLLLGSILWAYMAVLFKELPMSIAAERWEGTLEYTMMAPLARSWHLFQVGIYMAVLASLRVIFIVIFIPLFFGIHWGILTTTFVVLILVMSTPAFIGVGILASSLPLINPDRGAEAANIVNGIMLLISGIFYPLTVLPQWLQYLSYLSPATYAMNMLRAVINIVPRAGQGSPFSAYMPILWNRDAQRLLLCGVAYITLGLLFFAWTESYSRRNGTLARSG